MTIDQADLSDVTGLRTLSIRLDELAALEADWDSYGGLPPTARAIAAASRLMIEAVACTRQIPSDIVPFPNGGLQVVWERDLDELQIDVGPDGAFGYLAIHRGEGPPSMHEADDLSLTDAVTLVSQLAR
jgi:hypothetical protein